jgi:peroxiredoxin
VNRRLLAASLGAAVVISVAGGWALSRGDGTQADDEVSFDQPVVEQDQSIGTNAAVSGTPLPDVMLVDMDGNDVPLRGLAGTPMIINAWFSSCGPCKTELKSFGVVHGELGDKIRFIGVNPSTDSPEVNVSFTADRGVHYELYRDPDGAYTSAVGIQAFPVTLFVSADGTIVRQTGVLDEAELRQYAEELLA